MNYSNLGLEVKNKMEYSRSNINSADMRIDAQITLLNKRDAK